MGVDSGLPDFRGEKGFWHCYPAAKRLGLKFEQLANPQSFDRDPQLAWGFYGHRHNLYRATRPHEGFAILLHWAQQKDFFVFTSNVDAHFQAAGFPADRVLECHGSILHLQCAQPCCNEIWPNDNTLSIDEQTLRCAAPLPHCRRCGVLARPNVLMFNDGRFLYNRHDQQSGRFANWLESLPGRRVTILECGAGSTVPTVRRMCEQVALASDAATLIRINPRESRVPHGHISLAMPALAA